MGNKNDCGCNTVGCLICHLSRGAKIKEKQTVHAGSFISIQTEQTVLIIAMCDRAANCFGCYPEATRPRVDETNGNVHSFVAITGVGPRRLLSN